MAVTADDFRFLADKVQDYSGIALSEGKEYLLESRLTPIAKKYGLADIADLASYVKENQDNSILIEIIEAMTTNESLFFRDIKPFERLKDVVIPRLQKMTPEKKSFKIWSAACSTGQEAYSIAMTLLEMPEFAGYDFQIIATDLDFNVVEKAKEGLYTQFEVQRGIPINLLIKYFTQEGDQWRVKDVLKKHITFDKFNLLDDSAKFGEFDIIYCRNVLIYFTDETKIQVLDGLRSRMGRQTVLFTGSSESLVGIETNLTILEDMVGMFRLS